jgi:hypothetical protein
LHILPPLPLRPSNSTRIHPKKKLNSKPYPRTAHALSYPSRFPTARTRRRRLLPRPPPDRPATTATRCPLAISRCSTSAPATHPSLPSRSSRASVRSAPSTSPHRVTQSSSSRGLVLLAVARGGSGALTAAAHLTTETRLVRMPP